MSQIVTCKNCKNDTFNSGNSSFLVCPHCHEKINVQEYLEYIANLKPKYLNLATLYKRRITQIIDIFITLHICFFISKLFNTYSPKIVENNKIFLVLLFIPSYYFIFEVTFGKTIGKFLTQTKVVQLNGERITIKQAFIRNIIRFIPYNRLSGRLNDGIYGHDIISNTRVIDEKLKELSTNQ